MSGTGLDADRTLPCGRTVSMLLAHLDGHGPPGLAEHVPHCPHCTAELRTLEHAWRPVRVAADATWDVPPGLVDRALSTVRGLRSASGQQPTSLVQDGGTLTVAPRAAMALVRQAGLDAASRRAGVHLRGCSGDTAEVRVDLAVRYPLSAVEIADEVRQEVERVLRRSLGTAAPSVEVVVVDVAPPTAN